MMWLIILAIIFVGWFIVKAIENKTKKEVELKKEELKLKRDELALNPKYHQQQERKREGERLSWQEMMTRFAEEEKNAKNPEELKLLKEKHLKEHLEFFKED